MDFKFKVRMMGNWFSRFRSVLEVGRIETGDGIIFSIEFPPVPLSYPRLTFCIIGRIMDRVSFTSHLRPREEDQEKLRVLDFMRLNIKSLVNLSEFLVRFFCQFVTMELFRNRHRNIEGI